MGNAYFVDVNYEAAVEAYTKALDIKEDATTYQRRAAAYLALKQDLKVRWSFIAFPVPIFWRRFLLDRSCPSRGVLRLHFFLPYNQPYSP